MEALTVVSLVANIIQLVDAATDAATMCYDIYKRGASDEDLQSTKICDQLQQCYTILDDSLQSCQSHAPSIGGVDLKSLSKECCQSARSLHQELKSLEKSPGGSRREAVKKIIQRKWRAGDIERLKRRLKEYQDTLDTRVIVDIRQTINRMCSQQDSQYSDLDQQLSSMAANLASCQISTADILRTAIDSVVEANGQEHKRTRTHFETTVQGLTSSQTQRIEAKERHDRFLESLRFDDMKLRGNEITESHQETFGWIFKDKANLPWDNFYRWLQKGQDMYWINGKAGSGKSTLMKFIVEDERTSQALSSWANGKECIILNFYFWLSGSKLQRTKKGFLCSLLHQLMSNDGNLIESVFHNNRSLAQKRTIGDWSPTELKNAFHFALKQLEQSSKVCIFLDGLDEFDQNDDVDQLLDLIEEYAHSKNLKFCVSSRPDASIEKRLSGNTRLRLQDLTAKDMQLYISDTLQLAYERYPPNSIKAEDIDEFTETMTGKADGVFLWVHLAMSSLLRGLRNEDDFAVLLQRLDELPSGMDQLYQQMWQRLNGDEQLYREEASTYFSYHENFPLSLFEFMVALNGDLQTRYLRNMTPQDPIELAQRCKSLEKRVLTRCAGLLEVVTHKTDRSIYESSEEGHAIHESSTTSSDDGDSVRSPSEGTEEPQQVTVELDRVIESTRKSDSSQLSASDKSSLTQDSYIDFKEIPPFELKVYHGARIKFLHRTARDFLLNTKVGHGIAGETPQTRDERFPNLIRARMATLLQGLELFNGPNITDIMEQVGFSDTKYEIELLKKLRRVCETLSVPGSESDDINHVNFWHNYRALDFLGSAVQSRCVEYVKHCLNHEIQHPSPYYRGYLFACAVDGVEWSDTASKKLELVNWLAQNGADLSTKHWLDSIIQTPFEYLLQETIAGSHYGSPKTIDVSKLSQLAKLIQAHFPTAIKSTDKQIITVPSDGSLTKCQFDLIYVDLGVSCCCRLAMYCLARLGANTGSTRPVTSRSTIPLRTVLLLDRRTGGCVRPGLEDSIHLGKAYEKVLFTEDFEENPSESRNNFLSCLKEVLPRCESVDHWQAERDIGYGMDIPPNFMVLDPSEDVDETNWREKGWFRTLDPITDE